MIIGLTGGIASGKSTVSMVLKELGAEIINADEIAHELLKKGNKGWKRVVEEFSSEVLTENKEINRKKLGQIVFNNREKRKTLENLTHPLIIEEIEKKINKKPNKQNIVIEAPLLYEVGLEEKMDEVWVVYVDKKTQIKRLKQRDNLNEEEALKRINSQLSLEKKKEKADIVINNQGTKKDLKEKVRKIWGNKIKN